jgi:hypothetical protein
LFFRIQPDTDAKSNIAIKLFFLTGNKNKKGSQLWLPKSRFYQDLLVEFFCFRCLGALPYHKDYDASQHRKERCDAWQGSAPTDEHCAINNAPRGLRIWKHVFLLFSVV